MQYFWQQQPLDFCPGRFSGALHQQVNAPVEYVLDGSQKHISQLKDIPDFVAASPQQEHILSVQYQGQEYSISYHTLSKEYLEIVYGIPVRGAAVTLYMNQQSLRQLGTAEKELLVHSADPGVLQQALVSIKLQLAEGIFHQETAEAVAVGETNAQAKEGQVRVCFGRRDLDGSQRRQLEQLGYTIVNQEALLEDEYQKEELFLRMKYETFISLLLSVGASCCSIWKK